jgi:outer membrane receptor protein involved in Fe transport
MERLQDVPVPVTAVSASDLVDSNQVRLQDYYTRVPSLNVAPGIQATQVLTIRGISTGGGNPTVGVVIDDVPFGGTTALGSGNQIPDFDPSDLARIEVLRGPQGTLYGVNSMGGLIKFVTVDPSTEKLTGRVQAGLTTIRNGDDRGYNARGAINVPLGETFAVRASGFARRDPGYIDDSGLGLQGVNEATAEGARLSALWRPTQDFSVKLSGLYQESAADASSDVFPSLGDLQQHYSVPGLGRYDIKNQAYSAVVNARLGRADLTALSGYNINRIFDSLDYTPFLGAGSPVLFGAGVTATPYAENQRVRKFSQEVRLSMPLGAKVDWLMGAFYTDESASRVQQIYAENPTTGVIAGQWLDNRFPTSYTEYAAFTDFTFHVTDRFNVQLGGRQSWNEATYESARVGPFVGPIPLIVPERKSDASAFTYIVTPQFRLSPEMLLYARLASGYRPGGPNTTAALAAGVPAEFDPDTTRNYEIGIKGNTPDRVVSYDASVFYIDWRDIQLDLRSSAGSYLDNGGRATSQGVELSLEVRPTSVLTIAAWTAWNDAKLKENLPLPPVGTVYGLTGDRLPLSSRFSGNLSLDGDFPLRGDMTAFFGVSLSYVGERLSIFRRLANGQPVPRQELPAYARTDVRAGIRYDTWAGNLFVNNVTDRRGVLAGGAEQFNPLAFNYIQPRTIGVTLTKSF